VLTLTIRQPWAWAIARGHKPIENRSWGTAYRGPLAIHAAAKPDDDWDFVLREVVARVRAQGGAVPESIAADLPAPGYGAVIAVVDLVDICREKFDCDCGPWAIAGQFHWRLANARVLDASIPARGRLSLWDCDVPEPLSPQAKRAKEYAGIFLGLGDRWRYCVPVDAERFAVGIVLDGVEMWPESDCEVWAVKDGDTVTRYRKAVPSC